MRANEFITEASNYDDQLLKGRDAIYNVLSTECKPYVSVNPGTMTTNVLYRGVNGLVWRPYEPVKIVPVRQDRRPTSTRYLTSQAIDNWFLSKFGIRFRSAALFCTSDESTAREYGEVAIVAPIGKFDYLWSPVYEDLYYVTVDRDFMDRIKRKDPIEEIVDDLLSAGNYQFNTGLQAAIDCGHEVMIHCQETVLINPKWMS